MIKIIMMVKAAMAMYHRMWSGPIPPRHLVTLLVRVLVLLILLLPPYKTCHEPNPPGL
jgi:hypothetical protein